MFSFHAQVILQMSKQNIIKKKAFNEHRMNQATGEMYNILTTQRIEEA